MKGIRGGSRSKRKPAYGYTSLTMRKEVVVEERKTEKIPRLQGISESLFRPKGKFRCNECLQRCPH